MKVVVIGAGQVGQGVVTALQGSHELTLIDLDPAKLIAVSQLADCRTVEGDGASRPVLQEAGIRDADIAFACTPRDEANLVAAMLIRRLSGARTIVRMTDAEYLEAWREGDIDVDVMVSSELETANAILRVIGLPGAFQADEVAEGRLQLVEFEIPAGAEAGGIVGRPLASAEIPAGSRVMAIIRGERRLLPRPEETIEPGDWVAVLALPESARHWSELLAPDALAVTDVVLLGAGRVGRTVARVMLERGVRVRVIESDADRAQHVAELLPDAAVFHAQGLDSDFFSRELIGRATAAVFSMGDDPKNLYAAILARTHGVPLTIAVMRDPVSEEVFELGGIDVAVNPRMETAEVMTRYAHDPRIHQIVMLDDDRFEVLDLTMRDDSPFAGHRVDESPEPGVVIGAVIRGEEIIFPGADAVLRPGDRMVLLVDSVRAASVERAL